MVPPGGFLRGEQFERERVVPLPPLSRLLCILSCRGKKVWPRWQALAESRLENRRKGYDRVSIPTGKYHPKIKPSAFRPLAPSVTCGDSSLPEGAMGAYLSIWLFWKGEMKTAGEAPVLGVSRSLLSNGFCQSVPGRWECSFESSHRGRSSTAGSSRGSRSPFPGR